MITHKFKVILIGAGAVGKTSLIRRFIEDKFILGYKTTIGVDFLVKQVKISPEESIKLWIWDIGGQERFKLLRKNFYNETNGALLVFDLSRDDTFNEIKKWYDEMQRYAGDDVPFLLIGNKSDLIEKVGEIIDQKKVHAFTEQKGSSYIDTSAKTGANVEKAFVELAKIMIKIKENR